MCVTSDTNGAKSLRADGIGRLEGGFAQSVLSNIPPKEDYVKKIINQSQIGGFGFRSNNNFNSSKSLSRAAGPTFGQSRMQSAGISGMNTEGSRNGDGRSQGRGSRSNFSGYRSNQSAGGGLASRFSLAISKIIEKDSILLDEGEEDEDIAEVI